MKKRFIFSFAWAVMAAVGMTRAAELAPAVNLIFDTDIGNDCDDAMALAVIHALQNRGQCRLLAVTLTNPDPLAGQLVDAINTFYGRGDIPIGINPDGPVVHKVSAYLKAAHDFPHDFNPAKAPRALAVLRRTLATAPDESVTLVQVGFFTNLAQLLASPADDISPLAGRELIQRKVRRLSLMAGAFHPVRGANYFSEFNVKYDLPAAAKVARDWPTAIVWSGAEIGEAILFPARSIDQDMNYVGRHPIKESYQLFRPTPHERPCYDLTAVLEAVWPERDYFELSPSGRVTVLPDGFTRFDLSKDGRDHYLIVDRERANRVRELFAALVTEPPAIK